MFCAPSAWSPRSAGWGRVARGAFFLTPRQSLGDDTDESHGDSREQGRTSGLRKLGKLVGIRERSAALTSVSTSEASAGLRKSDSGPLGPVTPAAAPSGSSPFKLKEKGQKLKSAMRRAMGTSSSNGGAASSKEMPNEADVLAQFDAFLFQCGLEAERAPYDELSLEAKWTMVCDHMAGTIEMSLRDRLAEQQRRDQKQRNRKTPGVLAAKLNGDPTLAHIEAVRAFLDSDTSLAIGKFVEAHGASAMLASLTALDAKLRKGSLTASESEATLLLLDAMCSLCAHASGVLALREAGAAMVVAGLFSPKHPTDIRMGAVRVLSALAASGANACVAVVEAWDVYSTINDETGRFQHLVLALKVPSAFDNLQRLTVGSLINALVAGTTERAARAAVRHDVAQWGFAALVIECAGESGADTARWEELLHHFQALEHADSSGVDVLPVRSASGSSVSGGSVGGSPTARAQHLTASSSFSAKRNSGTLPPGQALDAVVSELRHAGRPQSETHLRTVVASMERFAADDDWKWLAAARLMRMLAEVPSQAVTNADAAPESQLAALLLGSAAQEHVLELRTQVYQLRTELSRVEEQAAVTIRDLQRARGAEEPLDASSDAAASTAPFVATSEDAAARKLLRKKGVRKKKAVRGKTLRRPNASGSDSPAPDRLAPDSPAPDRTTTPTLAVTTDAESEESGE